MAGIPPAFLFHTVVLILSVMPGPASGCWGKKSRENDQRRIFFCLTFIGIISSASPFLNRSIRKTERLFWRARKPERPLSKRHCNGSWPRHFFRSTQRHGGRKTKKPNFKPR